MAKANPSEITPEELYLSRRKFLAGMGIVAAGLVLPNCGPGDDPGGEPQSQEEEYCLQAHAGAETDELGDALTPCDAIISYNNFYEFSPEKENVGRRARDFQTSPWTVEVGGLVARPGTFTVDELLKTYPVEERIYRLRCVEAWSMVIPWLGFPLWRLLEDVEPMPSARYVRFETLLDPLQMPGQRDSSYQWPYVEGLTIGEAQENLAILATGIYGRPLLPQDGAPIRLVVPWKYGFKSIKSIVRIDLVEEMPVSLWMAANPREYGFFANVNPDVPHPRWPQSSERRIGELQRRRTLYLNGYADEVGHLYEGLDPTKLF